MPRRMLALAMPILAIGAGVAPAATSSADHTTLSIPGQAFLDDVLPQGVELECDNDTPCDVSATLKITAGDAKFLGITSRTIATGTAKGPMTAVVNEHRYHDLYRLRLSPAFARAAKKKKVVSLQFSYKGKATFQIPNPALNGDEPDPSTPKTVEATSTIPDPDDLSKGTFGQGKAYGCRATQNINVGSKKPITQSCAEFVKSLR